MKVGRSEGILSDEPTRWENDKVSNSSANRVSGTGENGKDGWIGVVVGDAAHGVELEEIISIGDIVAGKGNNVVGRVVL
jgi:hypothetical protein